MKSAILEDQLFQIHGKKKKKEVLEDLGPEVRLKCC